MARDRLIERTLIDLASRILYAIYWLIRRATVRSASGVLADKNGWRVEDYKPANRACPTCPSRWVGPGSMDHLHIETCPVCAAVVRKPKYVKKVRPPRAVRVRKRYVSKGERS